jgi:hypothetical protein
MARISHASGVSERDSRSDPSIKWPGQPPRATTSPISKEFRVKSKENLRYALEPLAKGRGDRGRARSDRRAFN